MPRTPLMNTTEVRKLMNAHTDNRPSVSFGRHFIKERPEHSRLVGECLMAWAEADIYLGVLLAVIMQANSDTSIAVYQTIRRSTVKHDAIEQAASHALPKEDLHLIQALLMLAKTVEALRNDLAHGMWGVSGDVEDGLAWIKSDYMTLAHVKHSKPETIDFPSHHPRYLEQADQTRERTFIYRRRDLEDIERQIDNFIKILTTFSFHLIKASGETEFRLSVAARAILSSPAPIQERLTTIRRREDRQILGSSSLEPQIFDLL